MFSNANFIVDGFGRGNASSIFAEVKYKYCRKFLIGDFPVDIPHSEDGIYYRKLS